MQVRIHTKVAEAAKYLHAAQAHDGNGYFYWSDETRKYYRVSIEDLVDLYELVHFDFDNENIADRAFAEWCRDTQTDAAEIKSEADILAAIGPDTQK